MILYKAIKDFVAKFIEKEEIENYHNNGYSIIKEKDNLDIAKIEPTEEIPDDF